MKVRPRDHGAAAVEFALVVPILIALVLAIAVFGRGFQIQSSLSMAAREGAREMAISKDAGIAESLAETTADQLGVSGADAVVSGCAGGSAAVASVSYEYDLLGFAGFLRLDDDKILMTGRGEMRCGG